jgi:hypothetical protein
MLGSRYLCWLACMCFVNSIVYLAFPSVVSVYALFLSGVTLSSWSSTSYANRCEYVNLHFHTCQLPNNLPPAVCMIWKFFDQLHHSISSSEVSLSSCSTTSYAKCCEFMNLHFHTCQLHNNLPPAVVCMIWKFFDQLHHSISCSDVCILGLPLFLIGDAQEGS